MHSGAPAVSFLQELCWGSLRLGSGSTWSSFSRLDPSYLDLTDMVAIATTCMRAASQRPCCQFQGDALLSSLNLILNTFIGNSAILAVCCNTLSNFGCFACRRLGVANKH